MADYGDYGIHCKWRFIAEKSIKLFRPCWITGAYKSFFFSFFKFDLFVRPIRLTSSTARKSQNSFQGTSTGCHNIWESNSWFSTFPVKILNPVENWGVNIQEIDLKSLRASISLVPQAGPGGGVAWCSGHDRGQEPILWSGSVAQNLDPTGTLPMEGLMKAVSKAPWHHLLVGHRSSDRFIKVNGCPRGVRCPPCWASHSNDSGSKKKEHKYWNINCCSQFPGFSLPVCSIPAFQTDPLNIGDHIGSTGFAVSIWPNTGQVHLDGKLQSLGAGASVWKCYDRGLVFFLEDTRIWECHGLVEKHTDPNLQNCQYGHFVGYKPSIKNMLTSPFVES